MCVFLGLTDILLKGPVSLTLQDSRFVKNRPVRNSGKPLPLSFGRKGNVSGQHFCSRTKNPQKNKPKIDS